MFLASAPLLIFAATLSLLACGSAWAQEPLSRPTEPAKAAAYVEPDDIVVVGTYVSTRTEYPATSSSESVNAEPSNAYGSDVSYSLSDEPLLSDVEPGSISMRPKRKVQSFQSRLYGVLTESLCACDECYDPEWHLVESASFWVDSARPQNRTRFRWDYGPGMILPDRAEYFWARVGGRGPAAQPGSLTVDSLDYHELSMYAETAHGNFSAFVVTPYRSLYMNEAGHSAGFADLQIGTKSLLHDTPMLQVALQMTTTIPSANSRNGLGTGHVSLEPALLIGLALTERDFLQTQIAEWIPLGGDAAYQGALLRWGVAWNRIMWQRDRDNVATFNLDLVGWSFQDGAYTDPVLGPQSANDETYVYLGPGARWLLCGKFELGIGGIFALSDRHFAENVLRSEFTVRY